MNSPMSHLDITRAVIDEASRSRVFFVTNLLGAKPDPWQLEVLGMLDRGDNRITIRSGHGVGKAFALELIVPTPDGFRRWGDIQVGDRLFGTDGKPTKVTARYDHVDKPMYRVTFDDGASVIACGEHLWSVRGRQERRKNLTSFRTLSTKEILDAGVKRPNGGVLARQWEIPRYQPVEYSERDLPLDPYLLGVWLGNGDTSAARITSADPEIWQAFAAQGFSFGRVDDENTGAAETRTILGLRTILRDMGLLGNKHIPPEYLTASVDQRLALLRGLLDTDGWSENGGKRAGFCTTIPDIAEDVVELARSLAFKVHPIQTKEEPWYNDDVGERVYCKTAYVVRMVGPLNPFSVPRKAADWQSPSEDRYMSRWIDSIEPVRSRPSMCVTVDAPDSLFLTTDYIVTHNTALCAWCALHYLLFRFGVKVVVTSPSGRQMADGLKPELALWIDKLPDGIGLKEDLETTNDRIVKKSDPKNNFISFRTARMETPEALAGIHADHVMVIVDEASGVPEVVYEAAAGTLSTSGSICLLIGNPTRARGLFYRTHTSLTDHWRSFKVASNESPRVDQAFIEDIRKTYGVDSNQYRVRVLGEFPTSEEDMVIPYEMVKSALGRDVDPIPDSAIYWGIDPGRGGDATGFCARNANHVLELEEWHFPDLMRTVGKIKSKWDDTAPSDRPESVYVDSIGLGAGIADRLRELGLPVIDVNVSEAPSMRERFPRLRAEVWFQARAWFEGRNVCIPKALRLGEQLVDELSSPEMRLLSNGKTDVETKDDMRRRGIRSPNLADALNLTFSYQGAIQSGRSTPTAPWNKAIRSRYVGVA